MAFPQTKDILKGGGVAEVDFVFSDTTDYVFSDTLDYVFSEDGFRLDAWALRESALKSGTWALRTKVQL